jgi:hypothetical protein
VSENLRVTDRRMFTPEGELREEYKDLPPREAAPAPAPAAPPAAVAQSSPAPDKPSTLPPVETETGANFQDLVALLAQTASVYLQQAGHASFESRADHLEMARMHVDLLAVLKQKTTGNLDPMELALIDDILYRLRLAVVERG